MYDHDNGGYNNLIDVFDHRALNDDLHRAGYEHVYVHHNGGPDDEHLDYHYPAPWPYHYRSGHHHDKQRAINDDNRPQQHQHDDEHERARRQHHHDGCSDDDAGYAHDHDDVPAYEHIVHLDHVVHVDHDVNDCAWDINDGRTHHDSRDYDDSARNDYDDQRPYNDLVHDEHVDPTAS